MYRTHRLVHLLAPLALVGSIAAGTPLAHAATAPQTPTAATQSSSRPMPQPDLSVTICVANHCVTIKIL
jgi:hypothetical protein